MVLVDFNVIGLRNDFLRFIANQSIINNCRATLPQMNQHRLRKHFTCHVSVSFPEIWRSMLCTACQGLTILYEHQVTTRQSWKWAKKTFCSNLKCSLHFFETSAPKEAQSLALKLATFFWERKNCFYAKTCFCHIVKGVTSWRFKEFESTINKHFQINLSFSPARWTSLSPLFSGFLCNLFCSLSNLKTLSLKNI